MNLKRLSVLLLAWAVISCDPEPPAEPLAPQERVTHGEWITTTTCTQTAPNYPYACCRSGLVVTAKTTCEVVVDINDGSHSSAGGEFLCVQDPASPLPGSPSRNLFVKLKCTESFPYPYPYSYSSECDATVIVRDEIVPVLTLEGPPSETLDCSRLGYSDPGARALDPCEGDLTSSVQRSGEVNTSQPGLYTIKYEVENSKGRRAEPVTRQITVQDIDAPKVTCPPVIELQAESDGWATLLPPDSVRATDFCSLAMWEDLPGSRFTVGEHALKYKARDAAGNLGECTTTLRVTRASSEPPPPPPPPPQALPRDRAKLGGGCGAAPATQTSLPVVLMALVALGIRLAARRSRSSSPMARWLLFGGVLMSAPASAEPIPAFDLERLKLNPSGLGSWVMGTGELLPAGGYRVSLAGHYENKPLILYEDGSQLGVMVRHRITTVLSAAVGLWDRVELGAQLPLLLSQRGDNLTDRDVPTPQSGPAPGTPLFTVRLRLLAERHKDPLDLAVGVNAGPAVGSASALARELNATPSVMLGRRFGPVRAALDAGILLRPKQILTHDENIQDELGHALRFGAGLASAAEGFGGELAAISSVPLKREGYSLEVLGGLRLPVGKLLEVHSLAGLGMGTAPGTPRFRVLLGMSFGKAARSDDPEPMAPEDQDRDKDGILNHVDECPDEPGPASNSGCPIKDSDGDGVVDGLDKCPEQKGIVQNYGCPPQDTDGDTVSDHLDNCVKIPGPPSNQGCPTNMRQWVIIQRNRIKIDGTIYFDYDKDTIQSKSFPLLDQVAYVLVEHPEIVSISIEGHTDSDGTNAYNLDLSRRRANAVRQYLHRQGVARERMSIQGFGEERPLESNDTDEGRAVNRRVEFITRYASDVP
jgi:OOP family OmpA-OmpF porin